MVLITLEKEIEPKYGNRKKFLLKHNIHKQQNNKYHNILYNIVLYLDEMSEGYDNSIQKLVRDYLDMLYSYYWRFNRTPAITQLSPSVNNKIKFQEWIYKFEAENGESYWFTKDEGDFSIKEFIDDFNVEAEIIEVGNGS